MSDSMSGETKWGIFLAIGAVLFFTYVAGMKAGEVDWNKVQLESDGCNSLSIRYKGSTQFFHKFDGYWEPTGGSWK